MGIGAMLDVGFVMARPFLSITLALFAELGTIFTLPIATYFGYTIKQAAAISVVGGADGPMVLFTSLKLAPELFVPIAVVAYLYLGLAYGGYPYLIKFMIPIKDSNVKPAIIAGPYFAINTTAKVKAEYQGQSEEADIDELKSSEFGLQLGGGVGFPVGNGELGFDVRYIMGLSNIFDVEGDPDVKNSVINFNLFYAFSLK
jgi:hypothetical protein